MQNVLIKTEWFMVTSPLGNTGFFHQKYGFIPNYMKEKNENYYSEKIIKEITNFLLNN